MQLNNLVGGQKPFVSLLNMTNITSMILDPPSLYPYGSKYFQSTQEAIGSIGYGSAWMLWLHCADWFRVESWEQLPEEFDHPTHSWWFPVVLVAGLGQLEHIGWKLDNALIVHFVALDLFVCFRCFVQFWFFFYRYGWVLRMNFLPQVFWPLSPNLGWADYIVFKCFCFLAKKHGRIMMDIQSSNKQGWHRHVWKVPNIGRASASALAAFSMFGCMQCVIIAVGKL